MRLHEDLNGYVVVTTPRGAAQGQWAFADKAGHRYFIKMFLAPKYPRPNSPGSDEMKERKRAACAAFENRHQSIRRAVPSHAEGSGNLVVTTDFFRVDSTYYKITDMVHAVDLPPLYELEPRQTLTILRTLFFSLRLLHRARIVHSDLKPENVLFQQTTPGVYVAKVIDFDEAYISGRPPERSEVVGDQRFYSPELLCYITGDPSITARSLTTSSDIFSLGLLLHHAIVGSMPGFDRDTYQFACEAVVAGRPLEVFGLSGPLEQLVISMLQLDPNSRPDIQAVIDVFSELDPGSFRAMMTHPADHGAASPPTCTSPTAAEAASTGGGLKSTVRRAPIALGAASVTPSTPDHAREETPTPIPVAAVAVGYDDVDGHATSTNKPIDIDEPMLRLGDGEASPPVDDGRVESGAGPADPTSSAGAETVASIVATLTEDRPRNGKLKSTVRPK